MREVVVRSPASVVRLTAPWGGLAVLVVDGGLVLSGVLGVRAGVVLAVVLELVLLVVAGVEVRAFLVGYRRARSTGSGRREAAARGFRAAFPPLAITLARAELGLWRALWWALRRRRDVGPNEIAVPYGDRFGLVTGAILCLGALELGVVHVLTAPWPAVRWVLFALGVYALLWVLAFGLSVRQRPHLLRDGELVFRFGHFRTITVPLADLVGAAGAVVAGHKGTVVLDGDRLALPVMSDTNVELRFDPPVTVELKGGRHELRRVAFYADEPRTVVPRLRGRVLS
jgi:hypothetical protein